ncbi:MAG: ORF6N domain-containing protein [Kiritimatiellia bacterium]
MKRGRLADRESAEQASQEDITSHIMTMRGVQVMLDSDLAALYRVTTRVFNQAVKRNADRFPANFRFQLSRDEFAVLKSQIVTSKKDGGAERRGGRQKLPYAFTEQGIAMLSGVLKSDVAVQTSIRIMNTFVSMRKALASLAPLMERIESAERRIGKQEDVQAHNEARFRLVLDAMRDRSFPPQKVFFDGEFFDAFEQMKRFILKAKRKLIVIDPYFDDSCLQIIARKRAAVHVTVVVSPLGRRNLHDVDIAQFNRQYADSLTVKESEKFHDRYLIIDGATLIHVGASLNRLGKKCFAFSTLERANIPDIMARVS